MCQTCDLGIVHIAGAAVVAVATSCGVQVHSDGIGVRASSEPALQPKKLLGANALEDIKTAAQADAEVEAAEAAMRAEQATKTRECEAADAEGARV